MTHLPTIASIQRAVAAEYDIPVAMMTEPDGIGARLRGKVRLRQVAMRLSTFLTEHSLVRIGHFFGGRDHTTVISACKRVDQVRADDPKLDEFMCRVSLELVHA
jgi:chromosomal replication initiator protein